MLTESEIQAALHAHRVVPLGEVHPHGPLGLEHLAEAVARLVNAEVAPDSRVRVNRPISLRLETWQKLDELARAAQQSSSHPVTASQLAAVLIEELVAAK